MKLAICTIQRNRGRWLNEWFSFHSYFGFEKFYFFQHKCTDNTESEIINLQKKFDINAFKIPDNLERPQLAAYLYAYTNFNHEFDWVAFIDGDEFLYPTNFENISYTIDRFNYSNCSAVGIYWKCFGSSNHLLEPNGLIIENYLYRADDNFRANSHIKSLVRGRQGKFFQILANSHYFSTINGTIDENFRSINSGLTDYEPTYNHLALNHYVVQSRQFFEEFKKFSGSADAGANSIRSESWWDTHNRNEIYDPLLSEVAKNIF